MLGFHAERANNILGAPDQRTGFAATWPSYDQRRGWRLDSGLLKLIVSLRCWTGALGCWHWRRRSLSERCRGDKELRQPVEQSRLRAAEAGGKIAGRAA